MVYNNEMYPKSAGEMENILDPDQTAPKERYDLGLHSLLKPTGPRIFTVCSTIAAFKGPNNEN